MSTVKLTPLEEETSESVDVSLPSAFDFSLVADILIDTFNIKTYHNAIYLYLDGYYQLGEHFIRKELNRLYNVKKTARNEVVERIKELTYIDSEDIRRDPYVVNLNNTRFNIKTGKKLDYDENVVEFDRIPVTYNPGARCKALDNMINKVFCYDSEMVDLFYEIVGYCMIKHCKLDKFFVFVGEGSNGKSTIIELLQTLFGEHNYSTVKMDKLMKNVFSASELENKLLNVDDDASNVVISESGTLKTLTSGKAMNVERKYERSYTMKNYAKLIMACNEIPHSKDKSYGFYRRMTILIFNQVFSKEDPDFDPFIMEKITTEAGLSHLFNKGVEGAQRLIRNNGFTSPKSVEIAINDYKQENSNVLTWVKYEEITDDYLISKPADELYSEFCDWCRNSNIKNITGKISFYREITKTFNFEQNRKFNKKDRKRYFVCKL